MPKFLTQYRVFIGSPRGLDDERKGFRDTLEKFNRYHGKPAGVLFDPVGWEDTIGGVGRPQELINDDLRQCDYAVFVLHDRWGTPTGSGHSSGTEEEWELAELLYKERKIRNVGLFFKHISGLPDPDQLKKVLEFRGTIEKEKRHLSRPYSDVNEFCDVLEGYLAKWLRDHLGDIGGPSVGGLVPISPIASAVSPTIPAPPDFKYWITEAGKLFTAETPNYSAALFCAEKGLEAAASDMEWVEAKDTLGVALFYLNKLDHAIGTFSEIIERAASSSDADMRASRARALFNKGFTLGQLGRSEEAIAVYDEVVARFGAAPEFPLREQVASALVARGWTLDQLDRSEEAIATFDDVVARFGAAPELLLREHVAKALVDKGFRLGQLDRREEAIALYDDVVIRFGAAPELPLRKQVATALVNKGSRLSELDRCEAAIAVFDDMVARFGAAPELPVREQVAKALFNKGVTLGQLNRYEEAVAAFDEVVARFGAAPELPLREKVAKSLFNKGVRLGQLDRSEEEIAVYEEIVARFGTAPELSLRERVASALVNKGTRLGQLDRREEAIA